MAETRGSRSNRSRPMFPLGQIVITSNARATLNEADVLNALSRHARGDWGGLDGEDRQGQRARPEARPPALLCLPLRRRGQVLRDHRVGPFGNHGPSSRGLLIHRGGGAGTVSMITADGRWNSRNGKGDNGPAHPARPAGPRPATTARLRPSMSFSGISEEVSPALKGT